MADAAFSDLNALTTLADDDLFCVTDDSESSSEKSKKITARNVMEYIMPPGVIMAWPTSSPPSGFLQCNGAAVSRTTYADLFTAISDNYGNGDGSTTFNLPDFRGYFLRGYDNSAGNDPDAASRTDRGDGTTGDDVGTVQLDAFQGHEHQQHSRYPTGGATGGTSYTPAAAPNNGSTMNTQGEVSDGSNGTPRTSSETRSKNIAVMWIIKY